MVHIKGKKTQPFFKRKLFWIPIIVVALMAICSPVLIARAAPPTEMGGYVKIEQSGVCERDGMVQVRLAMYLYPGDYGYDKERVQVPVISSGGYLGKIDAMGMPIDQKDYNNWLASLPRVWQDNPFHNHFIYIDPAVSDDAIMSIGVIYLNEAYAQWAKGYTPQLSNAPISKPIIDSIRLSAVNNKVQHLKSISLVRQNTLFVNK